MKTIFTAIATLFIMAITLVSCKDTSKEVVAVEEEENKEAKALLQGIWLDNEDNEVTMKVKGDTIFYADSTMTPVAFAIISDSLELKGFNKKRYEIIKQTENIFQFRNQNGDIIKLVRSDNQEDNYAFENQKHTVLNQNQLIKRDSVVFAGAHKYHVYIQVNPSTYKVIRTAYNDDGIQVDNVYYDNIINVCIYDGGQRLFSSDIHKQDLKKYVPANYLAQSVLSDITLDKVTEECVSLLASVCMPDSNTEYIVRLNIDSKGHLKLTKE